MVVMVVCWCGVVVWCRGDGVDGGIMNSVIEWLCCEWKVVGKCSFRLESVD